jgi:FMN phosphatase YigB (HAD superfamily)
VLSCEVGKRKPHPAIYEAATRALGVEPAECVFVGDRRYEDVRGPSEQGMGTVLACWFRVDEDPRGLDPDLVADDPLDVLEHARDLLRS